MDEFLEGLLETFLEEHKKHESLLEEFLEELVTKFHAELLEEFLEKFP